jgi:predicted phosphodiesterase
MFSNCHRVLLISDLHGYWKATNTIMNFVNNQVDLIIQLGDFGFGFGLQQSDIDNKTWGLGQLKPTIPFLFVPGNHDNHYEIAKLVEQHGRVPIKMHPRKPIYLLPTGCLVKIGDKNVLSVAGANSIDKIYRKSGINWWSNEEPNYQDCCAALSHDTKIDCVVSHTCPETIVPELFKDSQTLIKSSEKCAARVLLDEVVNKYEPSKLFCGHWHLRRSLIMNTTEIEIFDALYSNVLPHPERIRNIVWKIVSF